MSVPIDAQKDGAHEDSFFILRDCRELFQKRLAEVARLAGVVAPSVAEPFVEALGEAHDELVNSSGRDGFEVTDGLTSSRITLMGDDDLELEIRINDIGRRLIDAGGNALWRAQLRYMTLLDRPQMRPEDNPVGPEAITRGLWAICHAANATLEAKLALLERVEEQFVSGLPDVYSELNDLLAARNIEPAQTQIVTSPGPKQAPGLSPMMGGAGGGGGVGYAGATGGNPLAALQSIVAQQAGGAVGGVGVVGGSFGGGTAQFGQMGVPVLAPAGAVAGGVAGGTGNVGVLVSGDAALNAATLVMLNQLSARLDQIEAGRAGSVVSEGGAVGGGAGGSVGGTVGSRAAGTESASPGVHGAADSGAGVEGVENAPPSMPYALKSKDVDFPLGQAESVALDTLAHIFEAIFDTWDLPDTVKTAIGRLQIPLLKTAIFDPTLFSDREHPARRLINAMARVAVGLPRDICRAHPVSTRLWQIASTVSEDLQADSSVLQAPLAELDAMIASRDQATMDAALPYITIFQAREVRGQSVAAARRWWQSVEAQGAPREVLDFLGGDWLCVMESACADGGESGSAWKESAATAADLLWSVEPKVGPEDRRRLAGLVPSLIKGLNAGLDRIGKPVAERAAFLDACFNLQTNALRGNPAAPVKPDATADGPGARGATVLEQIESDGHTLKILAVPGQSASPYRAGAAVPSGEWLLFTLAERETLCGQVCWLGAHSGGALLFNEDWNYAVVLGQSVLEQQLRDGRARVVSSRSIFDVATERALTQLSVG